MMKYLYGIRYSIISNIISIDQTNLNTIDFYSFCYAMQNTVLNCYPPKLLTRKYKSVTR